MTQVEIDLKLDQAADKLASSLFKNKVITVRQANSVYLNVKKLLTEKLK